VAVKNQPATAPGQTLTPGLRRYLYFTAAVTGAAIMIVEILGAKMLAPYLGTSHFVWTAQIAITLVALAIGYYVGGWLVDRSPDLGRMYGAILAAAVYLCFTIRLVEPVTYWCLRFKLALGSLLASAFLFFVPLALLAMTGPFFIRVLTVAVSGVGGNVGRLSAISTIGSFLGTILIGYVLIPFLRNSITMYLTAGVLMVVVSAFFLIWGRRKSLAGAAVAMCLGLGLGAWGVNIDGRTKFEYGEQLYRANSNFGQLQVLQSTGEDRRFYLNDFLTQNTYDTQFKDSTSMFTYMLHGLARAYVPRVDDVLCIGMGVGIAPMKFAREGSRVDVVEINPAVVPLAEKYFDLEPAKLNIVIGDGRQFVSETAKKYDAIVLDAFLGDSSPSHLMTREAFAAMRRILKPGGALVINSFCDFERGRDFFGGSLDKTLKAVFASVRIHAAGNGNVFFAASDVKEMKVLSQPNFDAVHPTCSSTVRTAFAEIVQPNPASGIVLTDDYNPIDYYDAANRESYRHYMALSMRRR
jgi:spermidine synthase